MRLLLVDGTNVVMRCASISTVEPADALQMAVAIVRRAVRATEATNLVVAFDAPGVSIRREVYPAYKAHRTTDTTDWVTAGTAAFTAAGIHCAQAPGYEADDVICTIAARSGSVPIEILSGDSDLLVLASETVGVWQFDKRAPNGFVRRTPAWVCEKYEIPSPAHLTLYKTLVGEPGDNVPGMPKVGPVTARKMIAEFGDFVTMRKLGALKEHAEWLEKAMTLLSLYDFAPVPRISRTATAVEILARQAAA